MSKRGRGEREVFLVYADNGEHYEDHENQVITVTNRVEAAWRLALEHMREIYADRAGADAGVWQHVQWDADSTQCTFMCLFHSKGQVCAAKHVRNLVYVERATTGERIRGRVCVPCPSDIRATTDAPMCPFRKPSSRRENE